MIASSIALIIWTPGLTYLVHRASARNVLVAEGAPSIEDVKIESKEQGSV